MPVVGLAHTSVVSARCFRDEFEDFCRWCPWAKDSADADLVKGRAVFLWNDATAKHNDVVKTCFSEFLADLREQMCMGA